MKFPFSNLFRPQEEIERALRRPPAPPPVGSDLHSSIMRAVNERTSRRDVPTSKQYDSGDRTQRRGVPAFGWMTFGTGMALAALCVGFWLRPQSPKTSPSNIPSSELAQAPGTALDFGAQLPALVMAPYSNEWARVDNDLHATTQDLLASLP